MDAILLLVVLPMLMMGCRGSAGYTDQGCMKWNKVGTDVCCEACYPGNRLVKRCGPKPSELCTPCEDGTFTTDPRVFSCDQCTQCVGALVLVKECTATRDSVCGCKDGLICGNAHCSFCAQKCLKGQEPTHKRSCRPCPPGTFNDQIHQKCKPWKTCHLFQLKEGSAVSDVTCGNITLGFTGKPVPPGPDTEQTWAMVLSVMTSLVLTTFVVVIIITVVVRQAQRRRKGKMNITDVSIVRTITSDEPSTLRAVECSFHEAEQEQGGSSSSLDTKDSTDQLLP